MGKNDYSNEMREWLLDTAIRERACARSKLHTIQPGQKCILVKAGSGGGPSYCLDCAKGILTTTKNYIDSLLIEIDQ